MAILVLANTTGTGTGWDLSGGVSEDGFLDIENIGVLDLDDSVTGFFFKPDGLKIYVVGTAYQVRQVDLNTAWDVTAGGSHTISSAAFTSRQFSDMIFSPDGTKMYTQGIFVRKYFQYTLSTPWDLSTLVYDDELDVTSQETFSLQGMAFSSDGTKFYHVGNTDYVYQYTLSSAWDLPTATYDSVSFDTTFGAPRDLEFSSDGKHMYVNEDSSIPDIHHFALSTAWDVSTASESSNVTLQVVSGRQYEDFTFNTNGTKLYALTDNSNPDLNRIIQYTIL